MIFRKGTAEEREAVTSYTQSPWVLRQVESHLILGPLSRCLSVAYVLLACAIALLGGLCYFHRLSGLNLGSVIALGAASVVFGQETRLRQAVLAFYALKITIGVCVFAFLIAALGQLQHDRTAAWLYFALAVIWVPGPEFVPVITPHQKYITIARLLLSLGVIAQGCDHA
jgi:hypothetical protein